MGLGLAFTLNIIQGHRANIEVTSVLSQGTTFTLIFPLVNKAEFDLLHKKTQQA